MRDIQQWDAVKQTALTASGGATPAVTGKASNFGEVDSNFSLVLVNDGLADDLTVTYQLGYMADGVDENMAEKDPDTYLTWITPTDGGAITALTSKDLAGSHLHASLTLAVCKYYRFIITNADAVNATTGVKLIIIAQF